MAATRSVSILVIGASAGGVTAVSCLLSQLGREFDFPVLITKHLQEGDETGLANLLGKSLELPVEVAEDKQCILAGHIYLAPGGYHLQVEEKGFVSLSMDERVSYARPSIDVLFETASGVYGSETVAVLLTGANSDGTNGTKCVHRCGGLTIAQNPATAETGVMPKAAIDKGCVDYTLDLDDIASFLRALM